MPELPEVETVRRGLAEHVVGRDISSVVVSGPRVVRRHLPGADDLVSRLTGSRVLAARRRGKYLWLELDSEPLARDLPGADDGDELAYALLLHLGMSGQLLVQPVDASAEKHLHARLRFADDGPELRFVDQRTFGGMALSDTGPDGIPEAIAHIAPDPFEPTYDLERVVARLKARRSAIKRGLLDQTVVSGIGNIYADEALWRAGIHGGRESAELTRPALRRVLGHARDVMEEALGQGGTSFDRLYVNVNGASGYFDRRLRAYGQEGKPCERCRTLIRREHFMNRSSFFCPRCQRVPKWRD